MSTIRVLIADNHTAVRHGLRALLAGTGGIEVIGEAGSVDETVRSAKRLSPDVVLMDIVMPRMDTSAALEAFLARRPGTRIVALRGSDADEHVAAALGAGTLSYVSKTASKEEFVRAIRQLAVGRTAAPPDSNGAAHRRVPTTAPSEPLSPRELEILRQLAKGMTNQKIAALLNISLTTVRTHISNVLHKLGASNRVEATIFALRDGLTTLEDCLNSGI